MSFISGRPMVIKSKTSAKQVLDPVYTEEEVVPFAKRLARRFKSGTVLNFSDQSATVLSDNYTFTVRKRQ